MKTMKIGDQVWSVKNSNIDMFRNCEVIPHAKTDEEWKEAGKNKQPAWCYYDNNESIGVNYGKLYNWYAITDERGFAPDGWHVPTKEDFEYIIKNDVELLYMLSGKRDCRTATCYGIGFMGHIWSGTNGNKKNAYAFVPYDSFMLYERKSEGLAVRLIKD